MKIIKSKTTVMEVYRMVMQQAESWKESAKNSKENNNLKRFNYSELCTALSQELYAVAANLERTPEINP